MKLSHPWLWGTERPDGKTSSTFPPIGFKHSTINRGKPKKTDSNSGLYYNGSFLFDLNDEKLTKSFIILEFSLVETKEMKEEEELL